MKRLLLLLLCCLPISCLAAEFRVCSDNRGIPPYVYIDGMGIAQYLTIRAAENLQLDLKLDYHPQPRCVNAVAQQHYDAVLIGSPNPTLNDVLAFPRNADGSPNPAQSYGHYRIVAFKLKGSPAQWDGRRFNGLERPLLYQSGVPTLESALANIRNQPMTSTRTVQNMIEMMHLGRTNAGVAMEPLLLDVLHERNQLEQFEILEPALLEADAYMLMGRHFLSRNPQLVRRIWDEIERLRQDPGWPRIRAQVQANRLPPLQPSSLQLPPRAE